MAEPSLQRGCWFCSGAPPAGEVCEWCRDDLARLSEFLHQFDGTFIVLTPPHPEDCTCEWCNAVAVAERKKAQKWKPIPPRDPGTDVRQEPPNQRDFIKVTHIDEARAKQIAAAKSRHPAQLPDPMSLLPKMEFSDAVISYTANPASETKITTEGFARVQSEVEAEVTHHPTVYPEVRDYYPIVSYDEMASHAHEFRRHPERAKPKTSGCYFCGDPDIKEMCEVCQHLVSDYGEWRQEHLPSIDL